MLRVVCNQMYKNRFVCYADDENDPSKMSLMDRIRLFEKTPQTTTKSRRCRARFSTEIVSADEIASARSFFNKNTTAFALGVLLVTFFLM